MILRRFRGGVACRGFTLIELLVAFMVLSLSLSVLFRIFSNGLANIEIASDYSRAVARAENQIALAGVARPLREGVTSGTWGDGYHWQQVVSRYVPWSGADELRMPLVAHLVTIEVSWVRRDRERRVSLSTIKLQRASQEDA